MSIERLGRIQALNDEVKEFHPVLRILLPRLPSINSVEYRQGANEMGADFVLEKRDETLLGTEYVGVIVKTGKIKQDHREIERQIEECELERTYGSGKKKVFLSEIWIVSNDTISQGAQDKINHKYKNKSIKFLPGEKILDLVNRFYPEYWTDISIKIGEYFRKVEARANLISAGSGLLGPQHKSIYIEQDLTESLSTRDYRSSVKRKKSIKYTLDGALKGSRFVVIEASMGTGKSTMLANAAIKLATPDNYNFSKVVPILSTLKEVSDTYGNDLSALVAEVQESIDTVDATYLLMLDGLDELNLDVEKQTEVIRALKSSIEATENVSLVIATRPLAVEVEQSIEKEFRKFNLSPFTVRQVISLVDAICQSDSIKTRLLKDLEKSNLFKALPKTPISAILLAKLLNENVHEIPSTMTELYGKYMELVMGRWDMSKGLQSQTEYEVIHNVTISLARFVVNNSLDDFSVAEARDMFLEYVGSRNLKIDAAHAFEKLLSRNEVFSVSHDRGAMSFRHRTFAEFFYAAGMDRDGGVALSKDAFLPYWATTYFFYFGIKRDAAQIVAEISSLPVADEPSRLARMITMPNMFLAAYLTPYETIVQAVRRYFDDAASLYMDVLSSPNKDSPLTALSQIDLLCIFTRIVSSAHAYEFFAQALSECAQDIYSNPTLNTDADLLELFFLNSALASIGDKHAFETLLSDYGAAIPLALRVGIIEHSDEVGLKTDAITRYAKRFDKSVRSNPAMAKSLRALIVQPIRTSA